MTNNDSPYAPPRSALVEDGPSQGSMDPSRIDLGEAMSFVFSSPGWLSQCLITCVLILLSCFVFGLGIPMMFGWQRRIYQRISSGQQGLPRFSPIANVRQGFPVLMAVVSNVGLPILMIMLPIFGTLFGMHELETGAGAEALQIASGFVLVVFYALFLGFGLIANLLMPELLRRAFKGEIFFLTRPGPSFRAIKSAIGPFAMVLLGTFVASMIGSLGMMACYIGLLLTFPLQLAIGAHLIAQWELLLRHRNTSE